MVKLNPVFRQEIHKEDITAIRNILSSTGFFFHEEIEIALELALDKLENFTVSSYNFIFADVEGQLSGYTCYGEIPCTFKSFDIYWIAVHPDFQKKGLGEMLLAETEKAAKAMGCRRIYIETSSRELYLPTQNFYTHCGYEQEAFLKDYYYPGDGKIIFVKNLSLE